MEFVDRVTHCEYKGCGQGDFLPFKCKHCSAHFCLAHKSALAHECPVGLAYQDMTSLDCPICNKPVKFSKAEDPDAVWRNHYAEACSQKPAPSLAAPQAPAKCKAPGCRNILGPSNTFKCPRCQVNVCLSHRRVEDHACPAAPKTSLTATAGSAAAAAQRQQQQKQQQQQSKKSRVVSDNKDSRSSTSTTSNADEGPLSCPFCGLVAHRDSSELQRHINEQHPDPTTARGRAPAPTPAPAPAPAPARSIQPPSSGASLGSGPEVCPQCQRRFADVMSLIQHVETAHSASSVGSGSDCSLS